MHEIPEGLGIKEIRANCFYPMLHSPVVWIQVIYSVMLANNERVQTKQFHSRKLRYGDVSIANGTVEYRSGTAIPLEAQVGHQITLGKTRMGFTKLLLWAVLSMRNETLN